MKTQKFPITAIIAVYFDNRGLIAEFPRSVDLLAFFAGKKKNEGFSIKDKELYNKAFDIAKEILPKQFPWLISDEKIQRFGMRPVLDYNDIDTISTLVEKHMYEAGNKAYAKGDDLKVIRLQTEKEEHYTAMAEDVPSVHTKDIEDIERRQGHGFWGNNTTGYHYHRDKE